MSLVFVAGCAWPGRQSSRVEAGGTSTARAVCTGRLSVESPAPGCVTSAPGSAADGPAGEVGDSVSRLLSLVDARLALMPAVARYKYVNDLSVGAPAREVELLSIIRADAERLAIDPDLAERFFRAQIEVSKQIQAELIEAWKRDAAPPPDDIPDLKSEIRPRITELSHEILVELARVSALDPDRVAVAIPAIAPRCLIEPTLTAARRDALVEPLLRDAVRRDENTAR